MVATPQNGGTATPPILQEFKNAADGRDAAMIAKDQDREHHQKVLVHNLNMGGADNARSVGLRATGAGELRDAAGVGGETEEQRKRREFEQAAIRAHERYVQMLEEEMARLEGQIDANNELLRLLRNGEFDRNNDDHIALIVAAGLNPNLPDDELRAAAEDNGDRLRRRYGEVSGVHRRATNPQNETEREQVIEEVRQWQEAGEPDLANSLTAHLDDTDLVREIDAQAGYTETQQDRAAVTSAEDLFSGGFGAVEHGANQFVVNFSAQSSFAEEVDQAQGVSMPGSDSATDTDQTASPAVTNDPDDDPENSNGSGGPAGPGMGGGM